MTIEIGQLTSQRPVPAPAAPVRPADAPEPAPAFAGLLAVDASDVIPPGPPPEVQAEVDAAWERGAALAAQNRELHFRHDERTGRTIIEVRTLDGEVLRTIPPSKLLDLMSGGDL